MLDVSSHSDSIEAFANGSHCPQIHSMTSSARDPTYKWPQRPIPQYNAQPTCQNPHRRWRAATSKKRHKSAGTAACVTQQVLQDSTLILHSLALACACQNSRQRTSGRTIDIGNSQGYPRVRRPQRHHVTASGQEPTARGARHGTPAHGIMRRC
jgi:hypothetical protein